MFAELTAALYSTRLEWKPSSLEFVVGARAGTAARSPEPMHVHVGTSSLEVKRVGIMRVLGELVAEDGGQRPASDACVAAAERRWFAAKRIWYSKVLARGTKLHQFYARVVGPLLHMSEGWHITTPLARRLAAWEKRKLRV